MSDSLGLVPKGAGGISRWTVMGTYAAAVTLCVLAGVEPGVAWALGVLPSYVLCVVLLTWNKRVKP